MIRTLEVSIALTMIYTITTINAVPPTPPVNCKWIKEESKCVENCDCRWCYSRNNCMEQIDFKHGNKKCDDVSEKTHSCQNIEKTIKIWLYVILGISGTLFILIVMVGISAFACGCPFWYFLKFYDSCMENPNPEGKSLNVQEKPSYQTERPLSIIKIV